MPNEDGELGGGDAEVRGGGVVIWVGKVGGEQGGRDGGVQVGEGQHGYAEGVVLDAHGAPRTEGEEAVADVQAPPETASGVAGGGGMRWDGRFAVEAHVEGEGVCEAGPVPCMASLFRTVSPLVRM